jgi:hypothetical protein
VAPFGYSGEFTLQVTAFATESAGGAVATTTRALAVSVKPSPLSMLASASSSIMIKSEMSILSSASLSLDESMTFDTLVQDTVYVTNGTVTKALSSADLPVIDWSGSLLLPREPDEEGNVGLEEYWVVDFLGASLEAPDLSSMTGLSVTLDLQAPDLRA